MSTRKDRPERTGNARLERVAWKARNVSTTSPSRGSSTTSTGASSPARGTARMLSAASSRPSSVAGAESCTKAWSAFAPKTSLSAVGKGNVRMPAAAVTQCRCAVE